LVPFAWHTRRNIPNASSRLPLTMSHRGDSGMKLQIKTQTFNFGATPTSSGCHRRYGISQTQQVKLLTSEKAINLFLFSENYSGFYSA
jgi:hypothetical protein